MEIHIPAKSLAMLIVNFNSAHVAVDIIIYNIVCTANNVIIVSTALFRHQTETI